MEHRDKILGIVLFCVVSGTQALTLGRLHGAALIGQPLDVAVDVALDPTENVTALCLEVEVFQADVRQDANRVRLQVEPTAPGMARVRVQSSAVIEEPVVSFNLRSGCASKNSRRYDMLADLPGEVSAAPVPLLVVAANPGASPASAPAKPDSGASEAVAPHALTQPGAETVLAPPAPAKVEKKIAPKPRLKVPHRSAAKGKKARRSAALAKRRAASVPVPAKPAASAPGLPRLKLDALAVLLPAKAASAPAVAASVPAVAASAPESDPVADSQKVQTLQGDVQALRAAAAKTEASLAEMKNRLQKAESERYSGALVLGLLALLLASLLAAALLWARQRRAPAGEKDWWSKPAPTRDATAGAPPAPVKDATAGAPPAPRAPRPVVSVQPALAKGKLSVPASDRAAVSDSVFSELMRHDAADAASEAAPDGATAPVGAARQLLTEPIKKLRQQVQELRVADKAEAAVQLLRQQIRDSREPNPFVYLDLLGLLHALGRQADFQLFSQDTKLMFNVDLPDFAFFREQGKGLESYPEVLSLISGIWPKPEVLLAIESCVFRDPWAKKTQPFDLAAFADLLLLHSVAQSELTSGAKAADLDLPRIRGASTDPIRR